MFIKRYLFAYIILTSLSFTTTAQDTIFVADEYNVYSNIDPDAIVAPVTVYVDRDGTLTIDEVVGRLFEKNSPQLDTATTTKGSVCWFKMVVKNTSSINRQFIIDPINFGITTSITLYDTSLTGRTWVMNGLLLPDSLKNSTVGGKCLLNFYLDVGQVKTLFLSVHSSEALGVRRFVNPFFKFGVASMGRYEHKDLLHRSFSGMIAGFLLLMLLYNLALFIKIGTRDYLALGLYSLSALCYYLCRTSLGFEIFGHSVFPFEPVSLGFCVLTFIYLAAHFEKFPGKSFISSWFIRSAALVLTMELAYLVVAIYQISTVSIYEASTRLFTDLYLLDISDIPVLLLYFSYTLLYLTSIIVVVYCLVRYYKLSCEKDNVAKYFVFANAVLFTSIMLIGLNGLIYYFDFFNDYLLEIGLALQSIVFAVGLAQKMQRTLMAKNQSQAELIVQMEVNAILQEKVNRELEDKVRERTAEIELQKEEIVSQSEEITVQRDLLFAQKKELTDSMEYARHIQQALLGSSHTISGTGLRHFIFYKPKDIVSGDFYWFKQVKNYLYFAAADCTGHGVPGAFMSILGVSMLNEIVGKRDMNQPSFVLNELRKKLKKSLNQDAESRSKDGMDITLGFLNLESLRLQFAGAFNPLVLVRNNELIEYLTDRMPVGVHPKDANSFTHNELQLMTGDQLFVFSDGYLSQFGGDKGKKLNKSHFKDILLDISSREPGDQMAILGERLEQWQGNYDQIDDILVIGIKI